MKTFSVSKVGLPFTHHFDGFEAHSLTKVYLRSQTYMCTWGTARNFPESLMETFGWSIYYLISRLTNFSRAVNTVTLFCCSLEQMFFTQEGKTKREYKKHYRFGTEPPSCMGEELKLKQHPTIIHDVILPELSTVYTEYTTLFEQNDVMKEDDLTALDNVSSFSVAISKFTISFNSVTLKLLTVQNSNTY